MKKIIDQAKKIFDVIRIINNGQKTFLILALVSRPDRDLDIFISDGKKWKFPGFYKNFNPKIKTIIQMIKEEGLKVNQKKYSDLNIKNIAVNAGIGWYGKNSLVIHPKFGPWLRFVVLEIDTFFKSTVAKKLNSLCNECDACLKSCPENVLEPYKLIDKEHCLAYLELDNPTSGFAQRCDMCLISCPIKDGSYVSKKH